MEESSLEKQRRPAVDSLTQESIGIRFGSLRVADQKIKRTGKKKEIQIRCLCDCGIYLWVFRQNLISGKSTQCKGCASRQQHKNRGHAIISSAAVSRVQKRCNAMKQRCENLNDPSFKNYGGRGIKFQFQSVAEAIAYVLKELPHPTYLKLDIDRKNNDGHYSPGNLRLVTRTENHNNKRTNRFLAYKGTKIPRKYVYHVLRTLYPEVRYAETVVQNLVCQGLDMNQIVARWFAPSCKPKGSTILPTPDPAIASLYLVNLSPTAT